MDYQPPAIEQVQINVDANVARPDDRDRVRTFLEMDDLSIGVTNFNNPNSTLFQIFLDLELLEGTDVTVGGSALDGSFVPTVGIEQLVLDESDLSVRVYYERGLNDSDPRAVESLIQHNTIGAKIKFQDNSLNSFVEFNSDGTEIYQHFLRIPLTENEFLTLQQFMRASSQDSEFMWTPESGWFTNTGVLISVPLIDSEDFDLGFGVQPGIVISGDTITPSVAGGIRGAFQTDDLEISGVLGYTYGINGQLRIKFNF